MARRRTREQAVRRRPGVFSLAVLAVLAAAVWLAPAVVVQTSLRDRPLEAALAGIDGKVTSRAARWQWLGGIEYRDVVVADAAGRPAVIVPSLVIEKGLLGLALDPRNLGTVRLSGVEAAVTVLPGGSSLENILAPWLAMHAGGRGVACEIELVDGTIELADTTRADAWRITDLIAAGSLSADGSLAGWTAAGRVRHAGRPQDDRSAGAPPLPRRAAEHQRDAVVQRDHEPPPRLDRTTIPAAAAAALARDGGWSVSAPAPAAGGGRVLAVTTHRLPLGISSVAATRFGLPRLADGLADVRLDVAVAADATQVQGRAVIDKLAICDATTLVEEFALERCELPLDVVVDDRGIAIRELRAISPVAEAELSGRLPLPGDDPWAWLEAAVLADCAAAARIDLAAAARSLPGGLAVRDDVKVTGGSLQLSAVARADGADRVLEVRLDARNLAAVRAAAADDASGERLLRWSEPLTAWLRGRRGPGRGAGLRIEEARLASEAAEISATGTPAALRMQWTVDLGGIVGELAEILDFGGVTLAGKARGTLEAERAGGGVTAVKLAAAITDFEFAPPGRPVWRDDSLALDAELVGSFSGNLAAIERARGVLASAGDSLEVSLAGGVLVDTSVVTGLGRRGPSPAHIRGAMPLPPREAMPWIRAAAAGGEVTADCGLVGDLGRWYRRLAAAAPELAVAGLELGGTVQATAAVTPAPDAGGDAWRITKASGEIERFGLTLAGRRVAEPRIVATAAGLVRPATGAIEISSAELLSSSLSLRSGGATWLPGGTAAGGVLDSLMTRIRGRVQWQADLARLADWIVPQEVAEDWPVSGRVWGTVDVAETQLGLNLLAEATGSELVIARRAGPQVEPSRVWVEPQAKLTVEVTRPYVRTATGGLSVADRLVIDRASLESSTVAIAGRGGIEEWSARRRTELTGSLAYDWAQLSRLASPWTGGRIRLAGAVNRPFTVRIMLGESPAAARPESLVAADSIPDPGTLPLPEAWLAATRGAGDGSSGGRPTVTLPVKSPAARRLEDRLKTVSLDTSAAWTAAEVDGFPLGPGELAIRLVEGQLALGPFDLPAAGGRLRGAPWIAFAPAPGELVVPPGRIVERVQLTGELGNRFATWISPLLARSTETTGLVSIDVAGARLPLADPLAGEAAAQVVFEQFEVTPSGAMQPLVNLLGKLQAAVDPRFAVSDKQVLLRVRPEPIRVRLAERRLWHEGLVMDSGAFTVTSKGSVAADGSLAMLVEVAFRGDLVGQTPVVAALARTPLAIPLKGTLARPQFDAAAVDILVQRVLENTARAVIDDGIGRGLEALFGRPPAPQPAPGQPAPLTLPR